jgi:Polysaccharide lyase
VLAGGGIAAGILLSGGGKPILVGDFEGSLGPFDKRASPPHGASLVSSPVAHGKSAFKSVVRPGTCVRSDRKNGTCMRYHSQVVLKTEHHEGEDSWWGWSIYFPADWRPNTRSYNNLGDFHPPSGGKPCQTNISMGVDVGLPTRLVVRRHGGASCSSDNEASESFPIGDLGRWHRAVWHVKFSSTESGRVEFFWDGDRVVTLKGPNLYAAYHRAFGPKIGIYEGGNGAVPETVYYDYVVRGSSFDDVAGVPG